MLEKEKIANEKSQEAKGYQRLEEYRTDVRQFNPTNLAEMKIYVDQEFAALRLQIGADARPEGVPVDSRYPGQPTYAGPGMVDPQYQNQDPRVPDQYRQGQTTGYPNQSPAAQKPVVHNDLSKLGFTPEQLNRVKR